MIMIMIMKEVLYFQIEKEGRTYLNYLKIGRYILIRNLYPYEEEIWKNGTNGIYF